MIFRGLFQSGLFYDSVISYLPKSYFSGYWFPELPIQTFKAAPIIYSLSLRLRLSQNNLYWKGSLGVLWCLKEIAQGLLQSSFLQLWGWRFHSLSGQFVSVFDHTYGDFFFLQIYTVRIPNVPNCVCCFFSCHHAPLKRVRLMHPLPLGSLRQQYDSSMTFPWSEQSQIPPLLLIYPLLQLTVHLGVSPGALLLSIYAFLVLGSPKSDTVLQVWSHLCCRKDSYDFPPN